MRRVMVKTFKQRVLWVFLAFVLVSFSASAAPSETNAFSAAAKLFQDTFYGRAETGFSNFVATYTNSIHRPVAILYQARSRFYQSNYVGAIDHCNRTRPRRMVPQTNISFGLHVLCSKNPTTAPPQMLLAFCSKITRTPRIVLTPRLPRPRPIPF